MPKRRMCENDAELPRQGRSAVGPSHPSETLLALIEIEEPVQTGMVKTHCVVSHT